jgi:glycosyltransferase involved in cell wall biosynthesis
MLFVREMAIKLGLSKITFYGHVRKMDKWLEDKNYLLSTATSEGCPNNVIEAMAKGIKPVIYAWPGAEEQFGENVFTIPGQAARMMQSSSEYKPKEYRRIVENKFGWPNFLKVKELVEAL